MYNPTTRLLTVLELLQSRGEMSGHELAQILEVEERSIRRYIMLLRDIGIPIDAERGRGGGYALRPGFRLPPLMFNNEEITAVMMGLMSLRESGSLSSAAVESAIAKIERVQPEALRQRAEALRAALVLEDVRPGIRAVSNEWINTFTLAAYQGKCLTIRYRSGDGEESERLIAPYGLVLHLRTWYAPAYCYLREDLRVFRLDRIRAVKPSAETFTKAADFDAREFVLRSLARIPGTYTFEILIDAPLTTVQELIPASLAVLESAGKKTLMRCYSDDPHWLARYLTRLEMPFTVVETEELRDSLEALAQEILSNLGHSVARPE